MAHMKPGWAWWAFIFHDLELATVNGADDSLTNKIVLLQGTADTTSNRIKSGCI